MSDSGRAAIEAILLQQSVDADTLAELGHDNLLQRGIVAGLELALNVYDLAVGCCDQVVLHMATCPVNGISRALEHLDDQCIPAPHPDDTRVVAP